MEKEIIGSNPIPATKKTLAGAKKNLKKSLVASRPDTESSEGFLIMATVLQRFNHLGLAHNNKILMIVGDQVSKKFVQQYGKFGDYRKEVFQKEDDEEFSVWDYPDFWLKEMDKIIINYLEHYLDLKVKTNG